jgi:hypothetical protein
MKESSIQIYKDMPNGFHLHSAEFSHAATDRLLHSADEWEVLAGILLSCHIGHFDPLARIPELLRQNDSFQFWKAATELLGYAGSWRLIKRFFEGYIDELDDRGVQYFLPIALANSCGLWAVEPLLAIHAKAVEEEPRYQIQRHLSYLLETENGPIWMGADEKTVVVESEDLDVRTIVDFEGYARDVRAVRDTILQSVGSLDTPVYEGQVLDIARTAEVLYERLTSKDDTIDRIYREEMLFEASTGVDCSAFFDKDNILQYLPAAAIMETFLESDAPARFEPGQRYFFGHPIPD